MPRAYASNLKPKAGDKVLYNWPKGQTTPATIKAVNGNKADIRFEGKNGVVNCATVFFSSIRFVERPKATQPPAKKAKKAVEA